MARPMPLDAPVTTAVFPERLGAGLMIAPFLTLWTQTVSTAGF
jgi:hypothetical protein